MALEPPASAFHTFRCPESPWRRKSSGCRRRLEGAECRVMGEFRIWGFGVLESFGFEILGFWRVWGLGFNVFGGSWKFFLNTSFLG